MLILNAERLQMAGLAEKAAFAAEGNIPEQRQKSDWTGSGEIPGLSLMSRDEFSGAYLLRKLLQDS